MKLIKQYWQMIYAYTKHIALLFWNYIKYIWRLLVITYQTNMILSIIIILLILIIIFLCIWIKYRKSSYHHLNQLPIEIIYKKQTLYKSLKATNELYMKHNIIEGDYEFIIYIHNDTQLYINQSSNILIFDKNGHVTFISNKFKKNMLMIHNFTSIYDILDDLISINTISNINLKIFKEIVTNINELTIISCKFGEVSFSLEFNPNNNYTSVTYELINDVKIHELEKINEYIYNNTSTQIVTFDANMRVANKNNNMIKVDMAFNDVKSLYDKYKFILNYSILKLSTQTLILSNIMFQNILIDVKNKIKDNLLYIISMVSKISITIKNTNSTEIAHSVDNYIQKIKFIVLIVQNHIEELILINGDARILATNIYDVIKGIRTNIKLLFDDQMVTFINLEQIQNIYALASRDLIEYLIITCYLLSFENHLTTSLQISTECINENIIITIYNINKDMLDSIYKLEYIYRKNNIEFILKNNQNNNYTAYIKINKLDK